MKFGHTHSHDVSHDCNDMATSKLLCGPNHAGINVSHNTELEKTTGAPSTRAQGSLKRCILHDARSILTPSLGRRPPLSTVVTSYLIP